MDIDKIIDGLVESVDGEDAYIGIMAEIADECLRKMSMDKIRNLYRNAGSDGCNLMETNYDRGFKIIYN